MEIGIKNTLKIERQSPHGWYLIDEDNEEVLLPNRYCQDDFQQGDELEVFVYTDSEDRLVASTQMPLAFRNEFAYLKVKQINKFGAFLDWGLDKDLFVPFSNQRYRMQKDESYVVFVYLDLQSQRMLASSYLIEFIETEEVPLSKSQAVWLFVYEETEIGYKAIIDQKYHGLLYKNELYKTVKMGYKLKGFVKEIREDGKIDLSLKQQGYVSNIDGNVKKVWDKIQRGHGFLKLNDKSRPEDIKRMLSMSKKDFKKAIGSLYKAKKITFGANGIYQKKH